MPIQSESLDAASRVAVPLMQRFSDPRLVLYHSVRWPCFILFHLGPASMFSYAFAFVLAMMQPYSAVRLSSLYSSIALVR